MWKAYTLITTTTTTTSNPKLKLSTNDRKSIDDINLCQQMFALNVYITWLDGYMASCCCCWCCCSGLSAHKKAKFQKWNTAIFYYCLSLFLLFVCYLFHFSFIIILKSVQLHQQIAKWLYFGEKSILKTVVIGLLPHSFLLYSSLVFFSYKKRKMYFPVVNTFKNIVSNVRLKSGNVNMVLRHILHITYEWTLNIHSKDI